MLYRGAYTFRSIFAILTKPPILDISAPFAISGISTIIEQAFNLVVIHTKPELPTRRNHRVTFGTFCSRLIIQQFNRSETYSVSLRYLSRFPEEPNPWLLGLGLLVPRISCARSLFWEKKPFDGGKKIRKKRKKLNRAQKARAVSKSQLSLKAIGLVTVLYFCRV
jgi:hypothetical protein